MNSEKNLFKKLNISAKLYKRSINKMSINYLVAGKGNPLILLHGAGIGWGQWYKNIPCLSRHFKVYAIDLPGSGNSTKINYNNLNFDKHVVDTIDLFIKDLNIKNPHIVGHSMGAWIGLKLATKKQHAKLKLVLANPLGLTDRMPFHQIPLAFPYVAQVLSKTIMRPTKKNVSSFLKDVLHKKNVVSAEFVNYVHEAINRGYINHPLILISRIAGYTKVKKDFIFIEEFSKMKNDILIIAGEYDPIVNIKQLKKSVQLNSKAEIKIFSDVGHVSPIESVDLFNKTIKQFLA